MIWQKIIPLLAAVWFWFFWEIACRFPNYLPILVLFAFLFPLIFLIVILQRIKRQGLPIRTLGWPLFLVMTGGLMASFLVDRPFLSQLLMAAVAILVFLDLHYLFLFSRQDKNYPIGLLEQINVGLLGFSFFLFSVVLFGWITFFAESLWTVLIVAIFLFYFFFLEMFFLRKIEEISIFLHSLILDLLAVEFFWVISLLSIGFVIKGLLFTLFSLYLIYLVHSFILNKFNKKSALGYFCSVLILVIIILGMARWI